MNYRFVERQNIRYSHNICIKLFVAFTICMLSACGGSEKTTRSKPNNQGCPSALTQKQMLDATNKARQQGYQCNTGYFGKAPTVTWDPLLAKAATMHADDMAKYNYFSHQDKQGRNVKRRLASLGLVGSNVVNNFPNSSAQNRDIIAGENISGGRDNIDATVKSLLESKGGHCELLMNPKYTRMGMTCSYNPDSEYGTYWVQVLSGEFELKKTD